MILGYNLIIVMKVNKATNYSKNNDKIMKMKPVSTNSKNLEPAKINESSVKQSQIKAHCPNCHFHFKVSLPFEQEYFQPKYDSPARLNIQNLIQRQFNELSPSSLIKMDLSINKYKKDTQVVYNTNSYISSQGLQRLKILNQICQMQRSRFKQRQSSNDKKNKTINNSPQSSRFMPTDKTSPLIKQSNPNSYDNLIQRQLLMENSNIKQSIRKPQETLQQRSRIPSDKMIRSSSMYRLTGNNREQVQKQVYSNYQRSLLLEHLIEQIRASSMFISLPAYLKIMVADQEILSH